MPERRRHGSVVALAVLIAVSLSLPTAVAQSAGGPLNARRLPQNPLITVSSSPTLGDNVNGPTVVRVPEWVERPLGKYYMYFANHMGTFSGSRTRLLSAAHGRCTSPVSSMFTTRRSFASNPIRLRRVTTSTPTWHHRRSCSMQPRDGS